MVIKLKIIFQFLGVLCIVSFFGINIKILNICFLQNLYSLSDLKHSIEAAKIIFKYLRMVFSLVNLKKNLKNIIVFFLIFLRFIRIFLNNVIFLWGILEVYKIIFIVYLFLNNFIVNWSRKEFLVYFGMVQLLRSVGLIFGLLISLDLWIVLMLLVKMGRFPLKDWVVKFFARRRLGAGFLFFSVNKVIPLIFFHDFLSFKVIFIFLVMLGKWVVSFLGILNSSNFLQVLGWSSIVRNGYFIFILGFNKKGYAYLRLFIYRVIFGLILYFLNRFNMGDKKKIKRILFILIILLFGVPPISMFLFKIVLFVSIIDYFSLFWIVLFVTMFFFLGVGYFVFFLNYSAGFLNMEFSKMINNSFLIFWLVVLFVLGVVIFFVVIF